jgi:TadE-like protein
MRQALFRTAHHERGQAIVEFALVLPVLLLLLLGVIFFARAYNLQQVLSGAAREGARVWAKNPPGGAWFQCGNIPCTIPDSEANNFYQNVIPAVKSYIRQNGFSDADVIFFTSDQSNEQNTMRDTVSALDADNEQVTITIYYKYSLPVGNPSQFTQIFLKASCTMKRG